ncbi:MAG: hypothetical protein WAT39_09085 [Planctomycetota bacterium]
MPAANEPGRAADPPPSGCARCRGDDVEVAWEAARSRPVRRLIDESHYGIRVTACDCGQPFAVVFTESIDWVNGDDPQTWLVVPLAPGEAERLTGTDDEIASALTAFAAGRRFLVRTFPSAPARSTWWCDAGFDIGPHD